MTMQDTTAGIRLPRMLLPTILMALAVFALWFVAKKLGTYSTWTPAAYDDLWPRRYGFLPHFLGGTVAILAGLVQLWLGLTGRTTGLHRVLGRVYVGGVAVGSLGGFYLAVTSQGDLSYVAGLTLLSIAWMMTTGMAVLAIHRRAIDQHREWMIRSYIVTFAFVTFRAVHPLLVEWKLGSPVEASSFMAWACWSIPLLLAEPLIQMRKLRP